LVRENGSKRRASRQAGALADSILAVGHFRLWPFASFRYRVAIAALGRELGVPTPTFNVMYAALKPYADGTPM